MAEETTCEATQQQQALHWRGVIEKGVSLWFWELICLLITSVSSIRWEIRSLMEEGCWNFKTEERYERVSDWSRMVS